MKDTLHPVIAAGTTPCKKTINFAAVRTAQMHDQAVIVPTLPSVSLVLTPDATLQELEDWAAQFGDKNCKQYFTKLKANLFGASLDSTCIRELEELFPKARRGRHPRPDLGQSLTAYIKWRENIFRAAKKAIGAVAIKKALRAQQDGWSDLLNEIEQLTKNGGPIHSGSTAPVTTLSDLARRAGMQPWDLDSDDAVARLEAAALTSKEKQAIRRAFTFLEKYSFLTGIKKLLPHKPLPEVPKVRTPHDLPDSILGLIERLILKAGSKLDKVMGEDRKTVADTTIAGYRAAMRHHFRTLPTCPADLARSYPNPVRDLAQVNDIEGLLDLSHLAATIRQTELVDDKRGTISQVTAYQYYSDILLVLGRNDMLPGETFDAIKTCQYMEEGRDLAVGMRLEIQQWCEALLKDPKKLRVFEGMHMILMGKAKAIIATAKAEGRALRTREMQMVRSLGTAAAACAIEYTGRPIRLANALGLRLRGARQNFYVPDARDADYRFRLFKGETKNKKDEAIAPLRQELHGHTVMAWYLKEIRKLFPHAETSNYLFPSVETKGKSLDKRTFDIWFQAVSAQAGLPMTFHRWRHGMASIILSFGFDNLQVAADMLGNTPAVCAQNYAWIDQEKLFRTGQDLMIKHADKNKL